MGCSLQRFDRLTDDTAISISRSVKDLSSSDDLERLQSCCLLSAYCSISSAHRQYALEAGAAPALCACLQGTSYQVGRMDAFLGVVRLYAVP